MTESEMHETIRALYQGIFDGDAWQRSLGALCQASDSLQASLLVRDTVRDKVLVDQVVNPVHEAVTAYQDYYESLDPGLSFVAQMAVGDWYIDARELGGQAMRQLPFYGDFINRFGMVSVMACLVERKPNYEVFLSLQRPQGRERYSADDARALDWAIPHVRHAVALRDRTHQVSALAHVSSELLERLPFGVIVFAEDGNTLLANRLGETWVRRLLPAATVGAGGTTPGAGADAETAEWRLSRPFAEALRAASDPAGLQPAQALRAAGPDGRQVEIVMLALPPAHHLAADWQRPSVLVAVHEAGAARVGIAGVLRELYSLTPAEVRLATLLTTGIGLPEACEQLGIRRETSRTQLKSIFTKTGTGTQAQLAHLMTRLGTVLGTA